MTPHEMAIEELTDAVTWKRATILAPSQAREILRWLRALESIANSACCGCCQEAATVARNALADVGAHPDAVVSRGPDDERGTVGH